MSKILKNTTGSVISLDVLGIDIAASSQITVNEEDFLLLASSESVTELTPLISSGDIVVNNGIVDLSATDGENFVKYPDNAPNIIYDNGISGLAATNIKQAIDEIAASNSASDFAIFSIWAEENAGLGNGQREWSFGNGATGDIGIVLPVDAQLFAVSYNAEVAGTNTEVAVVQNSSSQVATTGLQSGQDGFNTLSSAIQFTAGDRLGFQTITAGGATDVRVCAWFRVPISTLLDVGLNDLNDVTITAPANGEALVYNGTEWVNQTLPTGAVDSVNGQTGVVVLDADDIDDSLTTNKFATQAELNQIATNTSNIATNSGNIATNTSNIATNTSDISTNASNIATNTSNISTNTTNIANNTADIATNTANIATNTSNIATNTANIATNASNIAQNTSDITQNSSDIANNTTLINNHINDPIDAHDASAISYDNAASGLSAINAQDAIDEVDNDLDTHIADLNNPHQTTFTQAVAADPGTDITTAEAEELTDGSTTQLHFHRELVDETSTNRVEVLNGGDIQISNYPQSRNDTTVNDEKVLTTDGSGNVQLRRVLPFYASIKKISDAVSEVGINQTTTFEDWLVLNVSIPETGNYDIDWTYVWSFNDGAQDFRGRILLDGALLSTYNEHVQEPKDTAGTGVTFLTTTGGTANSGTNQRHRTTGFEPERNITAGAHTITIQWAGSQANDEATIYEGAIRIKRVS